MTKNLTDPLLEKIEEMIPSLPELRKLRPAHSLFRARSPLGDRVSDKVAEVMGSWKFIIWQSVILMLWIIVNAVAWFHHWDPYPFILLNLILSFQAAFTAPIIMMSQNRQSAVDRQKAEHDYHINLKAELEIEQLHQKMDMLREKEMAELIAIIREMEKKLPVK